VDHEFANPEKNGKIIVILPQKLLFWVAILRREDRITKRQVLHHGLRFAPARPNESLHGAGAKRKPSLMEFQGEQA